MSPQRKAGTIFLRDGFVFNRMPGFSSQ